jgi:flagellar hook-associated protein 1 FlgK
MVSSFFGLYTAQRSLSTNQTILNVINNNVANANTPGYSRQRVDLVTSSPFPQPIVGVQGLPGTFGTGAEIETITRTRDSFLDAQFRLENATLGYLTEKQYAFQNAEGILMEPSDSGITAKVDAFFQSAQELSLNPESLAVRTNFVQQAIDLTVVFQQQSTSLSVLRKSLVGEFTDLTSIRESRLGMNVVDINSKLENLANINREIITLKGNSVEPNDLLDQRDKLLDELNQYMPITVDETPVGSVNVSLGANVLVAGGTVVNVLQLNTGDIDNPAIVELYSPANAGYPPSGAPNLANANSLITNGTLGGLLEVGGHDADKVTIRGLLDRLDALATEISQALNGLQGGGRYIDSATGQLVDSTVGGYTMLFQDSGGAPPTTAADIQINQDIIDDPNRVAAAVITAGNEELGSSGQALQMAQLRNSTFAGLDNSTFANYHSSSISTLGVQAKSNEDKLASQNALLNQVDLRRESVSGVNIDEELIDLIRFQRAFEASSRVLSTMNGILDVLINRMG